MPATDLFLTVFWYASNIGHWFSLQIVPLQDHSASTLYTYPTPKAEDNTQEHKYMSYIKQQKLEQYGKTNLIVILILSLRLVFDGKTFLSILLVSKEWNKIFKPKIYNILLKFNPKKFRMEIWKSLLYNKNMVQLYDSVKEKSAKNTSQARINLSEKIRVDIIRSFHQYTKEYQD